MPAVPRVPVPGFHSRRLSRTPRGMRRARPPAPGRRRAMTSRGGDVTLQWRRPVEHAGGSGGSGRPGLSSVRSPPLFPSVLLRPGAPERRKRCAGRGEPVRGAPACGSGGRAGPCRGSGGCFPGWEPCAACGDLSSASAFISGGVPGGSSRSGLPVLFSYVIVYYVIF